jgi:nucleotide-binding universal stress UspA family protein
VVKMIVLAVDGSDNAQAATAWAGQLAGQLDAAVVAVHAVGLLEHERRDPDNVHLHGQLQEWTRALDELPAGRVRRELLPGEPVASLLRAVAAEKADLVVVGTRGTSARTGTLLGSTSLQLAERCPCPVVIVPPGTA